MNIYQRINEVQKHVEYIKKDTDVAGQYKAVSHDNVVAQIRGDLLKQGILVLPSLIEDEWFEPRKGKDKSTNWLYTAKYNIRFQNMEDSADHFEITCSGHANDSGDKAAGKACSYAVKTAILKVFLIETGVNDESRNFDPNDYTPAQQELYMEIFKEGTPFEFYAYDMHLPEAIRGGLFNSFEYDKTKNKKKVMEKRSAGLQDYFKIVEDIKEACNSEDPAALEYVEGMKPYEKRLIMEKLSEEDIKHLAKLSSSA